MTHPVSVVGIGADGWAGLTAAARSALDEADVVVGSERQLNLLESHVAAARARLPSPLRQGLLELVDRHAGRRVAVLASGDPMLHGIGATMVELLGADRVRIVPHISSVTLACAAMRWAVHDADVVSLVGRPVESLHAWVQPGRRLLVLSADGATPRRVAQLLRDRGFGPSRMTVLADLGHPDRSRASATAQAWDGQDCPALNVVAVECVAGAAARVLARTPGLADDAFEHDGQLTKREVRAVTLAHLAPSPGQLLWDVGAGAGSIAIEWMRTHPACRAIAVESDGQRAERIRRNAAALGVPGLDVVHGRAPTALGALPQPHAVFVGGGAGIPGVLDVCFHSLRPGGRIVVNAVTLETEAVVTELYRQHGGDLVQVSVNRVKPLGGMLGRDMAMPVTIWSVAKPVAAEPLQNQERL